MQSGKRVLVVDDAKEARELLAETFNIAGWQVSTANDGFHALELFPEVQPDLVVTDLQMPGSDGIELIKRLRAFTSIPVIVLTAHANVPSCARAMQMGAHRFLRWREDFHLLLKEAEELLAEDTDPCPGRPATVDEARDRRDRDMRAYFSALVEQFGGNVNRIATHVGKHRTTVAYHLDRFGLR